MTLKVPASERILRRIQDVDEKLGRLGSDDSAINKATRDVLSQVRRAYIADLIDVLNEEETYKPKSERVSFSLKTTEEWVEARSKSAVTI